VRTQTIHELPPQERPREKLLARGVAALTDAEIVAILLQTGTRGSNAELLVRYGSLVQVARASVSELARLKGIVSAKAIQLTAAFAIGTRLANEEFGADPMDSPIAIHRLLARELRMLDRESLRTVLLDTRYRLIAVQEVSKGTLNESPAHPRERFLSLPSPSLLTPSSLSITTPQATRVPAKPISLSPVNWPRPRSCFRSPCSTM